jgi:hypothetical protein
VTPPRKGWLSSAEIKDIFDGQVQLMRDTIESKVDAVVPAQALTAMLQDDRRSSKRSALRRIPVVLLCYGGGGGTFATVDEAVRRGHSVIVVPQSGRAAYAIHAWRHANFPTADGTAVAQKGALLDHLFNERELGELACVVRGGRRGMMALLDSIAHFPRLYLLLHPCAVIEKCPLDWYSAAPLRVSQLTLAH